MPRQRLLIIDDEPDMLEGLQRFLALEFTQLTIATTCSGREALSWVRKSPVDVVLLDIRMPEIDGLELLEALRKEDPWLTVVMMTAYGSIEVAVEAMKRGAYDFVTKPFEREALIRAISKALERNRLIRENLNLKQRLSGEGGFHGLLGQSPPMRRLLEHIQAIARTDYTVLIRGESGTGKELVARAIHALSKRKGRPLVVVNCPAIPEHLLESELFGHRRGAFTGADRDHPGLFEEADGGTIFLDEIGDVPVAVQTKLLRVLQEQEVKPLGAKHTRKIDVRVIASTNQDLEAKIEALSFREDLYYRLNVTSIVTPPLREIRADIPLLANHFAKLASAEIGVSPRRFSADALEELMHRPWPGNVRELQNLVRRAVMFAPGSVIRRQELQALDKPPALESTDVGKPLSEGAAEIEPYSTAKERLLNQFTHAYVTELLRRTAGNVTRAAELSGLGRASLQKIMRRLAIRSEDFRKDNA